MFDGKLKCFIGSLCMIALAASAALCAQPQTLVDGDGNAVGTQDNPIYITGSTDLDGYDTDDLAEGTTNMYWKEAPSDNITYGRKNAEWIEVTGGTGSGEGDVIWEAGAEEISLNATESGKDLNMVGSTVKADYFEGDGSLLTNLNVEIEGIGSTDDLTEGSVNLYFPGFDTLQNDYGVDTDLFEVKADKGVANGYASLDSSAKLPLEQLPITTVEYKGLWDADTNTPTLSDLSGSSGDLYIVSVAGTQDLGSGEVEYEEGQWLLHNGTMFEATNIGANVESVNGYTGVVDLNLYDLADVDLEGTGENQFIKYNAATSKWGYSSAVVMGTSTTARTTAAKTVTIADYVPVSGDILAITFSDGIAASSPTLNINGTGAKAIQLAGAAVSTTILSTTAAVPVTIMMYYDGTAFQLMGMQRNSDTNTWDRSNYTSMQVGSVGLTQYKIGALAASDNKFYPFTVENSTATNKTVATQKFRFGTPIVAYSTTTAVAADALTSNLYGAFPTAQMRYTFNQNAGYTLNAPLYLVVNVDEDGLWSLDNTSATSWYTQTLPSTEDGKVYIYIGYVYAQNTIYLMENNPAYIYSDGQIKLYGQSGDSYWDLTDGTIAPSAEVDSVDFSDKRLIVDSFPSGVDAVISTGAFEEGDVLPYYMSMYAPAIRIESNYVDEFGEGAASGIIMECLGDSLTRSSVFLFVPNGFEEYEEGTPTIIYAMSDPNAGPDSINVVDGLHIFAGEIISEGGVSTTDLFASDAIIIDASIGELTVSTINATSIVTDSLNIEESNVTVGGDVEIEGVLTAAGIVVTDSITIPNTDGYMTIGANVTVDGNVWADAYYGDGSNLTGVTTTPAGSNTQVQFNNSGSFGADSGFTYNAATGAVYVAGSITFDGSPVFNFTDVTETGQIQVDGTTMADFTTTGVTLYGDFVLGSTLTQSGGNAYYKGVEIGTGSGSEFDYIEEVGTDVVISAPITIATTNETSIRIEETTIDLGALVEGLEIRATTLFGNAYSTDEEIIPVGAHILGIADGIYLFDETETDTVSITGIKKDFSTVLELGLNLFESTYDFSGDIMPNRDRFDDDGLTFNIGSADYPIGDLFLQGDVTASGVNITGESSWNFTPEGEEVPQFQVNGTPIMDLEEDGTITIPGQIVGGDSTFITGLDFTYNSTSSLTMSGGSLVVDGKYVAKDEQLLTVDVFSNGSYTYLYCTSGGTLSFSATAPAKQPNGTWYKGSARCIGAFYCTGASTISQFINRGDTYIVPRITIASSFAPNGAWQSPTTESSAKLPVNAVSARIYLFSIDTASTAFCNVTPAEFAVGGTLANETMAEGYGAGGTGVDGYVALNVDIPLGASRNIKIQAADNDNDAVVCGIQGYRIRR